MCLSLRKYKFECSSQSWFQSDWLKGKQFQIFFPPTNLDLLLHAHFLQKKQNPKTTMVRSSVIHFNLQFQLQQVYPSKQANKLIKRLIRTSVSWKIPVCQVLLSVLAQRCTTEEIIKYSCLNVIILMQCCIAYSNKNFTEYTLKFCFW